jgi:alcohol dehydrogenase, propanol-preferring
MQAMVLTQPGQPLALQQRPLPLPGPDEVRLRVLACAVCRTDLHVADGELPQARYPVVPGHEVVGIVEAVGPGLSPDMLGRRVGLPWLGGTCGRCAYCLDGRENLCDAPEFTGCTRDGGFATHVLARAAFCLPLDGLPAQPAEVAPLLCAGLIGWRTLRAAGDGARSLGLYGFGAAAHLIVQVARHEGRRVAAFTRPGDTTAQALARRLGAHWAGGSDEAPPEPLDAALIFAPAGALVPQALAAVRKGGCVVCGGIHMSDIPSFPYRLMWEERQLRSVANLTRRDGEQFLSHAARHPLDVHFTVCPLQQANEALADLRAGRVSGAAVLVP